MNRYRRNLRVGSENASLGKRAGCVPKNTTESWRPKHGSNIGRISALPQQETNAMSTTMTTHKIGTRQEWLAARLDLLQAEKELTRRSDELAKMRQELPWVRIDKEYRFDTEEG